MNTPSAVQSDHAKGFVAYGLSRPLPANASTEMREGYDEHRNDSVSRLSAARGQVVVLPH